jgi:hypothetical protein
MRLRKAFLALHDFQLYLNRQDFIEILTSVAAKPDLHPILSLPAWRLANLSSAVLTVHHTATGVVNLFNQFGLFMRKQAVEAQKIVVSRMISN